MPLTGLSETALAPGAHVRHDAGKMFHRGQRHGESHLGGPYRSPGQAPEELGGVTPSMSYFIDAMMVLVIALTVLTIGQWSSLVEQAARRFMGF